MIDNMAPCITRDREPTTGLGQAVSGCWASKVR